MRFHLCAGTINFATNRHLVFGNRRGRSFAASVVRYFSLVGVIMCANYASMHFLHETIGLGLLLSKLITEAALFTASYPAALEARVARALIAGTAH